VSFSALLVYESVSAQCWSRLTFVHLFPECCKVYITQNIVFPNRVTWCVICMQWWETMFCSLHAGLVAVHCTHGLNRTGYLVCRSVPHTYLVYCIKIYWIRNKSDISYLKTSRAFDVQIHSRAFLAAVVCWLVTL